MKATPAAHPDAVWHALADPTRRAILDLLRERPRTSGEIAEHFPTSRFAIRKHLNTLAAASLVVVRWHGRERWNHLNVMPLQDVYERWVGPYQQLWARRITKFKQHLEGDAHMSSSPSSAVLDRLELEINISAPPSKVWTALTEETTLWWPKDFYTGPATGFHMEARIGGRVYEDWGNGAGAIWYEIFALNPGVSMDLRGNMGVPYGPAVTLLHLELRATKTGTVLTVSDSTIGAACDRAEKQDGWLQIFSRGLQQHVERVRQ